MFKLCLFVPVATHFFFVCVLCVAVCQRCRFLKSLLDIQTMASLCVLSSAVIIRCLSLCVFCLCMCERVCLTVHCSIKKGVPLCYNSTPSSVMLQGRRQDGANQGWYVHRQGEGDTGATYVNKKVSCDCHVLESGKRKT